MVIQPNSHPASRAQPISGFSHPKGARGREKSPTSPAGSQAGTCMLAGTMLDSYHRHQPGDAKETENPAMSSTSLVQRIQTSIGRPNKLSQVSFVVALFSFILLGGL